MKRFINWFVNLKIAEKIMLYYFAIFLAFFTIIFFTYRWVNDSILLNRVSQISMESVSSMNANLSLLIETVNNQSKVLISSQTVQRTLANSEQSFSDRQMVNNYLAEFINFNDLISSIYMFDNDGNKYYVDNASFQDFDLADLKGEDWYDQLVNSNGGYFLKLNGGGLLDISGQNYVSLIRVVNSIDTQKPVGFLLLNISEEYILRSIKGNEGESGTAIILRDEHNNDIIKTPFARGGDFSAIADERSRMQNSSAIKWIENREYIISNLNSSFGWNIINITPFNELTKQVKNLYSVAS